MSVMTKEEAIELLPEYINQSLPEEKRKALEHLVEADDEIKLEMEFLKNMKAAIKEENIESPTEWGLSRLKKSISEEDSKKAETSFSPWWKKAAIAASCAFVIQSGFLFQQQYSAEGQYRALSTGEIENTLQIQFKDGIAEAQVRQLLISLQGNIVSGPSAVGIYSVQFEDSDAALEALKQSQLIQYAEKGDE